jgi:DNA replication initiation complex subunit (GINS family)
MITYNDIYEAAKKERYSENLQPIPKSFVKDVSKYLKEKKEASMKEEDVFSDVLLKTKKQLENAITLFQELLRRRRKKILNLVLIASETGISKQDFDNMLLVEKGLFEELMKCVENSDRKLNEMLNGGEEEEVQQNSLVVFLEEANEFVASDGIKYGPYEVGQFVNLPKDIAKIFIEDKIAESMEKS